MSSRRPPAVREMLPGRRPAVNARIEVGDFHMTMGVGFYADGRPAEVFVSDVKAGSHMDAVARDAAILLSIAMQYGLPLAEISKSLTQDGQGKPSSVIGELVRQLVHGEITKA